MNKTKYIVFESGYNEDILIFGSTLKHSDVVNMMRLTKEDIISAGFVAVYSDGDDTIARCYGESTSLGIKSRGDQDTFLAKFALSLN